MWEHEALASLLRELAGPGREGLLADAERIAAGELCLWSRTFEVDPRRPAWRLDPFGGETTARRSERWHTDLKPVLELNRQQHLFTLAAGAALGERPEWAKLCADQLESWIEASPAGTKPGWTSGYETAHRLVGWAFSLPLVASELEGLRLERLAASYARQAGFVAARPSRFSSANNHRLAELTGLLAATLVCGPEDLWEALWLELEEEVTRQTYPDGGSREQAGGYFLYVLEILWVAGLLARAAGRPLGLLAERLSSMLEWLEATADAAGEPPPVGDDAEDRLLRPDYFSPRSADSVAARVRTLLAGSPSLTGPPPARSSESFLLEASGYGVLRGRTEGGPVRVVVDVGELGYGALAAHGHADALSVLVDVGSVPLLRDSGTGTYVPEAGRDDFRVSQAHSTVTVDGESQAEPLGPHLWGRRYRTVLEAFSAGPAFDYVRASHDGYLRRPAGAVHTRSVVYVKPDLLIVLDRVHAKRPCRAALAWQLAAGTEAPAVVSSHEAGRESGPAPFSPRYTWREEAPRVVWSASGSEIFFASVFTPGREEPVIRLAQADEKTVLEVERPRRVRVTETWSEHLPEVDL